jgi:Glycosyltransferase family 87
MRAYWSWIATMVATALVGSWAVRAIAFGMLPDAPPQTYGGFHVGLSLPIPVVQVAPHWYAILALWCTVAAIGLCGWRATRAVTQVWAVLAGYAIVALVLTFFSVTVSIDGYFYTVFARLFGVYGIDPYVLVSPIRVSDPILATDLSLLNNPPFPDPYGPGFTLLAGLVGKLEAHATLWQQLWTWRLISVTSCLAILAAVVRLLGRAPALDRAQRLAAVALNPLVLYESGVGGHNDFLMVAAAIWSYALVDELPLVAGLLAGVAISIKYFAAVLVPFIVVRAARANKLASVLIVVLAALVPVLCFHPFAFGATGQATLAKVGASLAMSPTWLLALPLFALKTAAAPEVQQRIDTAIRGVQLAIAAGFALIMVTAIFAYVRSPRSAPIIRSVTALLWTLPAMHPWYATWLAPAAAARSGWAAYAWWFTALSLLIYAHEAVLPTPVNHTIFIIIAVIWLAVPIAIARFAAIRATMPPHQQERGREQEGARA